MKGKQKVSSTENLLEMIRGNTKPEVPAPAAPAAGAQAKNTASGLLRGAVTAKGVNVGVEIGADALRIVKTDAAGGTFRLESCMSFDYPGELTPASDTFPGFLKSCLQNMGVDSSSKVWTTIPADHLEVYQFKIPKTPAKALSGAVYWAMNREKKFNEQQVIFDYTVLGEVSDKGIPKLQVVCYLAKRDAVQMAQRLFRRAGHILAGITFTAAAVNNLLRQVPTLESFESLAHVRIGDEFSEIDLFRENNFTFNRSIKTGSNSFLAAIQDHGPSQPVVVPGPPPAAQAAADPEIPLELESAATEPLTPEEIAALFKAYLEDPDTAAGKEGIAVEDVLAMITPALDRLVNQTERTLDYYVQTLNYPRVEKLLLTGSAALFPGLRSYMQEQLALSVEVLDPFSSAGMGGPVFKFPTALAQRVLFTIPLGLALADNELTPNFLHTYKEKDLARKNRLLSRLAAAAAVFCVVVAVGVYGWQSDIRSEHRQELSRLQGELAAFRPELNAPDLQALYNELKTNKTDITRSLNRHKPLAALAEISAAATPNILLHGILVDSVTEAGHGNMVLEGFVSGDRQLLESYLASYIMRLQATGLLGNAKLQRTSEDFYPELGNVLKFTLSVQYS